MIPSAAKQDAFEESIRLKNQFRNLDEDEVEFLDSVLESTRKREAEVKKQTSEQLELFRRQQEEADKAALEGANDAHEVQGANGKEEEERWAVNRGKRKRVEEKKGLKGFKLRKVSSSAHDGGGLDASAKSPPPTIQPQPKSITRLTNTSPAVISKMGDSKPLEPVSKPNTAASVGLGLAGYSSDEED